MASGPVVARVDRSAVVLSEHHAQIVVCGEQDIQVEAAISVLRSDSKSISSLYSQSSIPASIRPVAGQI
jgi:hypothetical protein